MSKQVSFSHISPFMREFNHCYEESIQSTDPHEVEALVRRMSELSEKITIALEQAPVNVSRYFSGGEKEITVDVETVSSEVQDKLAAILAHSMILAPSPLIGRVEPIAPPPSNQITTPMSAPPTSPEQTPKTAQDYATGFGNKSGNCWANSLLSMIVFVPSFRQAYETVAAYHAQKNVYDPSKKHGIALQNALKAYQTALQQKQPVSSDATQEVRLAFNHFFGHVNPLTLHEIFSKSQSAHEDAYEAMQVMMGEYERILREQSPENPAFSGLYCPMETRRHYRPVGEEREADPLKVSQDDYSRLSAGNSSGVICNDYQILLDVQNKGHLSFPSLLTDYFRNTLVDDHNQAQYLLANGHLQNFKLIGECRQFLRTPGEFMLTIKRFGAQADGRGYKITTPVMINRMITLPPEATLKNKLTAYELDSFIVHSGGTGGGHYICYKKIEDRWVEADDSRVRFVEESEIDQILHGEKGSEFTSYMHHYSRVAALQPLETVALSSVLLIETDIEKYTKQRSDAESAVKTTQSLSSELQNVGSAALLSEMSLESLSTLRYAIWLNDKTPDVYEYGTRELEKNPKRLQEIKLPWLIGKKGTPLLDQLIAIQKRRQDIAAERLLEVQLRAFLLKLNNPAVPNEELLSALQELPQEAQSDLHGLIYFAHKIKFGEEYVDQQKFNHKYGEIVLTNGDLRKTLLEAKEFVLNPFGNNIVQQLAASHRIQAEKLQYAYEKEQLQAFRELLTHYPTYEITPKQLAKAFDRLEIRKELKEKIYWSIWIADRKPNVPNYGANKFNENPRRALAVRDPILAEPPTCPRGSDIFVQLIALLDKESIL